MIGTLEWSFGKSIADDTRKISAALNGKIGAIDDLLYLAWLLFLLNCRIECIVIERDKAVNLPFKQRHYIKHGMCAIRAYVETSMCKSEHNSML